MLCSALYAGCPAIIALRRGKSKGGDMSGGKFFAQMGPIRANLQSLRVSAMVFLGENTIIKLNKYMQRER